MGRVQGPNTHTTAGGSPKTRQKRYVMLGPWGLAIAMNKAKDVLRLRTRPEVMMHFVLKGLEEMGVRVEPADPSEVKPDRVGRKPNPPRAPEPTKKSKKESRRGQ